MVLLAAVTWLLFRGIGVWGVNQPGRLGLRDRQLRLVDRHRPRRDADLGDPALAAPELAQLDQPVREADDDLRRRLRRPLSGSATPAARGSTTG
jgi:hypothetical protein